MFNNVRPFAIILLGGAVPLFCQLDRAPITGVVSNSSGGIISDAKVTALSKETATSLSTLTTATGNYILPALFNQPGCTRHRSKISSWPPTMGPMPLRSVSGCHGDWPYGNGKTGGGAEPLSFGAIIRLCALNTNSGGPPH